MTTRARLIIQALTQCLMNVAGRALIGWKGYFLTNYCILLMSSYAEKQVRVWWAHENQKVFILFNIKLCFFFRISSKWYVITVIANEVRKKNAAK